MRNGERVIVNNGWCKDHEKHGEIILEFVNCAGFDFAVRLDDGTIGPFGVEELIPEAQA
jgi:hypothetical protein